MSDFFVTIWEWLTWAVTTASVPITAFATVALAVLTFVLARATKDMAKATSAANVVANLETNQWAWTYLDLVVHNTGSGAAFDVSVSFDPGLPYDTEHQRKEQPFGKISVLRPGQLVRTGVGLYKEIYKATYKVTIQWKETPTAKRSEEMSYEIDIAAMGAVSQLGASSPSVQIAEQIKKLREDWQAVARGQRKLHVETFDKCDRARERAEIEAHFREREAWEKDRSSD